jgi:hypothetical protein
LLSGVKSSFANDRLLRYEDYYKGISLNDLKGSLRGYLPKNFTLIGGDKDHVIRFLKS